MYETKHVLDDVGRLYVSRKEGGRGLTSIEDSVDASIQQLKKQKGGLIAGIRNDADSTIDHRMKIKRKQKWE